MADASAGGLGAPFRTRKEGCALLFTDPVGVTWEVHDYANQPGPTDDEKGRDLSRRQAREPQFDNSQGVRHDLVRERTASTIAAVAETPNKCYPIGHPRAFYRAFIPRDGTRPPRGCELSEIADHRWYPPTIERQWRGSRPLPATGTLKGVESAAPWRWILVANGTAFVIEDDDGRLWRVLNRRFKGRNPNRKAVEYEPGSSDFCTHRVFKPLEHVARSRLLEFPDGAGPHPLSDSIMADFAAAHPIGAPPPTAK